MKLKLSITAMLCAAFGSLAQAGPVTYTEQTTGSGTLDGNPFTSALLTFTFTGDTTNVTNPLAGIFANSGTATVSIAGISGTATFTDTMLAVDNQGIDEAGIGDMTTNSALLFTSDQAFGSYDLTTSIGPVNGSAIYSPNVDFATDAGTFILSSPPGQSTYTATLSSGAAEPSTALLLLVGPALLVCRSRKQH